MDGVLMKLFLIVLGYFSLVGCGGDEGVTGSDVSGRVANASLVMEFVGTQEFTDLGFTLKKMRVWKSRANNEASGAIDKIDSFAVEMWYQLEQDKELAAKNAPASEGDSAALLEGEEDEFKYTRYQVMDKLRATDDGFIFPETSEPGVTVETIPTGLGDRLTEDGLFSYTRNETDGLINAKYPAHMIYNEVTGETGSTITKKQIIKANEIADSGWENRYAYQLSGSIDSRTRYEKNADFATKGKLGCLVKPVSDADVFEDKTFIFGEVELGDIIRDSSGAETSANVEDAETLGDDDELWVPWSESWYLTGLNWQTKTVRILRNRTAPFYMARELPGVDSGDDTGKPSSINTLVKSCNDAAKSTAGSWQFIGFNSFGTSATLTTQGSSNTFCQSLKDITKINEEALNNTDFGCAGFNSGVILPGTFDGATHSGPLSSVGSSLDYQEMSGIVEVVLP